MKKILITGASGFIGGFLVEEALKNNYTVYAGIRETSNLQYLQDKRINFFKANLSSKESIKENLLKVGKFDYIIHNAGATKTCDKKMFNRVNFEFTKNFIEVLYETNNIPDKFVQISSLAAYGPGNPETLKPIEENDNPNPLSLYGKSKLKAEQYIKSLKDFPYLIFRPTGVYGPREKDYYVMYKSIKQGIETYVGTKKQYISFIYVKDLAELLIKSLSSSVIQKSYFVSDLKNYTSFEFNSLIKKNLNKKTVSLVFPLFFVKFISIINEKLFCFFSGKISTLNKEKFKEISQTNWLCDSSDLVKDFEFKPKYDLEKGLEESLEWYKTRNLL
ncbi:MAG: NAD(P)-dependent oxidoreductase [Bacteroidales bacterium]|nr:NAD(P)-dependent oxidoreductase [Bacteroidales bacterium]